MVQFPYTFEYLFKAIRNLTKLNTLMLYNASEAFILKLIAESAVGYNDSFREKFLDKSDFKQTGISRSYCFA